MKLVVINGSPRGPQSNTRILLGELVRGYDDEATQVHDLTKIRDSEERRQIFSGADAVVLGFPLYTDAMPGLVMGLIEDLAPLCGRDNMPAVGFLVQCGFPETAHIRPLERYLERLAGRMGCHYLGTLAKGGCEGIHMQPPGMNRKFFGRLAALGRSLAQTGTFDPVLVRQLAGLERLRWYHILLIRMLAPTGLLNFYWNMLLKRNGAYDRRFAAPYAPAA